MLTLTLKGQSVEEIRKEATSMAKSGDLKSAIAILDKAEADGKITNYMYIERGSYKDKVGDLEGAVEDFDKGLATIAYNWAPLVTARGVLKYRLERFTDAAADFTKVIEAGKVRFYDSFYWRGICKLKLNDKAGACEDFKMTLPPGNWYEKNYSSEVKAEMFRNCN